jgi:hypothetical protein
MWHFKKFRQQEFVPLIKFLIGMYEPDVYVEIGVQKAITFNQLSPLVKEAHAVDITPMPKIKFGRGVISHKMSSVEFAAKWDKNKKIDLLFIDGDHQYSSVLEDFKNLSPFVTPGTGLILLHDTYPSTEYLLADGYCSNAWIAAEILHKNKEFADWEILTLPGPYAGISILRNAKNHLHWRRKI